MHFIYQFLFNLNLKPTLLLNCLLGLLAGTVPAAHAQCDPTVQYDQIVSSYHSTIARQPDGSFRIWGTDASSGGNVDFLVPTTIDATTYVVGKGAVTTLTGTPLLASKGSRADAGSQAALLTTTGLWTWGKVGYIFDASLTPENTIYAGCRLLNVNGKADGLPPGVSPGDVKMLFATAGVVALLVNNATNNGTVWVLPSVPTTITGYAAQIDAISGQAGATANPTTWYKVKTAAAGNPDLTGVVAVRGAASPVLLAQTATGQLYTWGNATYLGDNTGLGTLNAATLMTLPTGLGGIAQIGMTRNKAALASSYYVRGTDGKLYGLGENSTRQLGDLTGTDRATWVRVHKPGSTSGSPILFNDCTFFSPQEHDSENSNVNAIDASGNLIAFGENSFSQIGASGSTTNPAYPMGFTAGTDKALYVETGGHTTIYVKEGTDRYCYVGHKIKGSMGDNTTANVTLASYDCATTALASICSASSFDSGDAPLSYDGGGSSLAQHYYGLGFDALRLGANRPQANNQGNLRNVATNTNNNGANGEGTEEDGIAALPPIMSTRASSQTIASYAYTVSYLNNTGAPATLAAWIDWNTNGTFEPGEGLSTTVPTAAAQASYTFTWTNQTLSSTAGRSFTYTRVRLASADLSTATPTGALNSGEVEDYAISFSTPLPVQLVSFEATKQGPNGLLSWKTASETNSAHFEVQVSTNGLTWQVLGKVAAVGTSPTSHAYTFPDRDLARYGAPAVYYRLQQVDLDGKATFSVVRTLALDASGWSVRAYPNPFAGQLSAELNTLETTPVSVAVYDALGNVVLRQQASAQAGTQLLELNGALTLAPGIYLLRVAQGAHAATVRVSKQ